MSRIASRAIGGKSTMARVIYDYAAAENINLSMAFANRLVDRLQDHIVEELTHNGRYTWRGLGSFKVVTRAARRGINPSTRKIVQYDAHNTVVLRASPQLKEQVNKKY